MALAGIANPTPELVPDAVSICWLMPITLPSASSSGPPELPGLIDASVWIALSIENSLSDWIERSVAETIPVDSDCSSPNGLPIAATCSPTAYSSRSEISSVARSSRPTRSPGSILIRATSASGSKPTTSASTRLRSLNSTKTCRAGFSWPPPLPCPPLAITWALVRISPSSEITKPDPWPAPPPPSAEAPLSKMESTVTTPGAARS